MPRLLEPLDAADDFYLDSVSQIRLPSWSQGRITLAGDVPGFAAYERAMADAVAASRTIGPSVLGTLIPRSEPQVWTMARALRVLPRLPGFVRRELTSFGGGPAAMLNGVRLRDPLVLRA
ncbi:hypothetical protein [Dactylosporangium sp. NPDC050588]|uniref:hypothetical protein n=1 Tax=Dactylosporangium sp. NPDC050588 TaxID=3157211 RepID=UPI0033F5DF89